MKPNPIIGEVRWERIPAVAALPEALAWLSFQACRGLALNTLDAYGRNLERYLRFLNGEKPWEIKQDGVGAYLHGLGRVDDGEEASLANATIQQHLATLRLFYDYLVEERRCTRNPFRRGEGAWARPLIQREHKLPWIPNRRNGAGSWRRHPRRGSETR
jgi:integrase/recombinase XerD